MYQKKFYFPSHATFLMDLMHKYFRLEIEGIENIPKQGPGIILPNHSGFAGFDAMILPTRFLKKSRHRIPRVLDPSPLV